MKVYNIIFIFITLLCLSGCAVLSVDSYYSPEQEQIKTEKELFVRSGAAYMKHFGPDNIAIINLKGNYNLKVRAFPREICDVLVGPYIPFFPNLFVPPCHKYRLPNSEKNVLVVYIETPKEIHVDWDLSNSKLSTLNGIVLHPSSIRRLFNGYSLSFIIKYKMIESFKLQFGKLDFNNEEFLLPSINFVKSKGVFYSILNP